MEKNDLDMFSKPIRDLIQNKPDLMASFNEQITVVRMGNMLRLMREKSGLTQVELAKRLKTSQSYLSVVERGLGKDGPTILMIHKIAQACEQEIRINFGSDQFSFGKKEGTE